MPGPERHTIQVSPHPDGGFTIQTHKWRGTDVVWSGHERTRPTLEAAVALAETTQRRRLACGWNAVLVLPADTGEVR